MLIIEGPDGTGKTTLSENISQSYDIKLFEFNQRPKTLEDFIEKCNRFYNANNTMVSAVADRCPFISEYVYGSVLGNQGSMIRFEHALSELRRLGCWTILCMPANESEWNKCLSRHVLGCNDSPRYIKELTDKFQQIMLQYCHLNLYIPNQALYNFEDTKSVHDLTDFVDQYMLRNESDQTG